MFSVNHQRIKYNFTTIKEEEEEEEEQGIRAAATFRRRDDQIRSIHFLFKFDLN